MAAPSRLYLVGTAPVISPAAGAGWESSANMVRSVLQRTWVDPGSIVRPVLTAGSGVANDDQAGIQGIFGPLAGQYLSGTVKGQLGAREVNALTDARAQMLIRVIDRAGTLRFTALAMDTAALANEFNVGSTDATDTINRKWPRGGSQSLTPGNVAPGDYLVVEWGFRNHGTNTSNVRIQASDATATTDMPEDETTVVGTGSVYRAWIEFSQDLRLFAPSAVAFDIGMAG